MSKILTSKFGIPVGIIAVIFMLYQAWIPLVQPAISAFGRSIESLQVAHAAAPGFPQNTTIGDAYNGARWYTVSGVGIKSYKCRPTASLHLDGYYVDHREPFEGQCTPENIGKFLEEYFKKIREVIKNAPAEVKTNIEGSINVLREAAIKQGVKFSTQIVPPAP